MDHRADYKEVATACIEDAGVSVTVLDTKTREKRQSNWLFSEWWWCEGNGCCDCNRELLFGRETVKGVCLGTKRYLIVAVDPGVRAARGGPPTDKRITYRVRIPGRFDYMRIESAQLTISDDDRFEPVQILALERTASSEPLDSALKGGAIRRPVCLVVGNEVAGISAETLAQAATIC
jgi:hypothetical protein